MYAAEDRGEIAKGTANSWAKHTKNISKLPEHVKKSKMTKMATILKSSSPAFRSDLSTFLVINAQKSSPVQIKLATSLYLEKKAVWGLVARALPYLARIAPQALKYIGRGLGWAGRGAAKIAPEVGASMVGDRAGKAIASTGRGLRRAGVSTMGKGISMTHSPAMQHLDFMRDYARSGGKVNYGDVNQALGGYLTPSLVTGGAAAALPIASSLMSNNEEEKEASFSPAFKLGVKIGANKCHS